MKILRIALVAMAMGSLAFAAVGAAPQTPEIDANTAASAVALLSGALLVLRSRRS